MRKSEFSRRAKLIHKKHYGSLTESERTELFMLDKWASKELEKEMKRSIDYIKKLL